MRMRNSVAVNVSSIIQLAVVMFTISLPIYKKAKDTCIKELVNLYHWIMASNGKLHKAYFSTSTDNSANYTIRMMMHHFAPIKCDTP